MRIGAGDGTEDRFAWCWSVTIGGLVGLLAMAHSLWWMSAVHGRYGWWVPGDTWILVEPSRFVASGALGYLYSAHHGFLALPLSAVLLAPAVWVGDHFNMVGGYPLPVPHPTSWLVIGPWELLAGIPALHAVRRLAARSGLRRGRLVLVQLWFAVVVLTPCAAWSHPEDVLAIAFLLYGLTALHDGRQERAALWVAAAVCSKQWALVAIPFLLVRTAPGSRRRVLLWCVVPPVLMAAFPLAVNWSDASQCLLFPPVPPAVRDGHYSLVVPLFTRLAGVHGSMLGRAMELSAAPVVAYALRRWPEAAQLGGLGGVLLLRLFFEPVVFPYYVAPAATLIGLACIAASRRIPLELMWWQAVLTVWLLLASPRNGLWWTGAVVLVVAMGWGGWRSVAAARPAGLRRPPPRRWPTLYRFSNFVSKSSRILDFGTKL